MSYRNELPQSGWNLPPGCSNHDIEVAAGSFDEEVSICPGYKWTLSAACGNEKDYAADLCDECLDVAQADEREQFTAEMEAEGIRPIVFYPHLTERE